MAKSTLIVPDPIVVYLAAIIMGAVLSILGAGGSLLTMPILVYLCEVNAVLASSYSLWVVGVAALIGALRYARLQLVSYPILLWFGAPSIVGVVFARRTLLPWIPESIVQVGDRHVTKDMMILILFAMIMIAAGIAMIYQRAVGERVAVIDTKTDAIPLWKAIAIAMEGLIVGTVTGLVGAGGGFLIIPVFVMLLGLPVRCAVGTSLAVISVKSFFGVAADTMLWSEANWHFLARFTGAAVVGILCGSTMTNCLSSEILKKSFGWLVATLGISILSRELLL